MHTGGRSADDIDAGGILPGYAGTIVRDGYAGYQHLADALHAWCGAHGLRDLRELYRWDPDGQLWARFMADLLIHANAAATAARAAGNACLDEAALAEIGAWYRGAVAKGITDNQRRRTKSGKDGLRLARRFRDHQDMILRFTTTWPSGSLPIRPSATFAPSRCKCAPPAAAGALLKGSPISRSSSLTCPPRPSGASTSSTP